MSRGGAARAALFAACLAASIFLAFRGCRDWERGAGMQENPQALLGVPVGGEEAALLREGEARADEPEDFALWQDEGVAAVGGGDAVSSARARLILIDGDGELILPQGMRLCAFDGDGCVIDEETAMALYGSRDIEGLALSCGGRERVVRGVFPWHRPLVVAQAGDEPPEGGYSRVTLRGGENGGGALAAEAFLVRNGLSGEPLRFDLLSGASWLSELVPGKWSDFEGWGAAIEEKREEAWALWELAWAAPDREMARLLMSGAAQSAAGFLLLFALAFVALGRLFARGGGSDCPIGAISGLIARGRRALARLLARLWRRVRA